MRKIARTVYHFFFRAFLFVRCWYSDRKQSRSSDSLPPALLRYRVSESLNADRFLAIGNACADHIEAQVNSLGKGEMSEARRILDFGCGCGRTLRWFMARHTTVEYHGVDVDAEAISWCIDSLPQGHFCRTSSVPPLPYRDNYFDIIYCLSVFTHLDESLQDLWLPELERILQPGGVLVMTIHGVAAAKMGLDSEGLEALERSGFVHRTTRKLDGIVPEWYNTTWHSQAYITARLKQFFDDVRYTTVDNGMQDFVLAVSRRGSTTTGIRIAFGS